MDKAIIIKHLTMLCSNDLRVYTESGRSIVRELILSTIQDSIKRAEEMISDFDSSILSEKDIGDIVCELEWRFNISLTNKSIIISDPGIDRGWLNSITDPERTRFIRHKDYENFLFSIGREYDVVEENTKIIDQILDLSGDPHREGSWETRGLVMGNVQSGKTQNYIGLINKAADLGYQAIIILGGHMNELRNQTQFRIDEGFVGQDTRKRKATRIGVGVDRDFTKYGSHQFTKGDNDFSRSVADRVAFDLNGISFPAVFVVKKNTSILESLYSWIKEKHMLSPEDGRLLDKPLLFIDDEADYASVNTLSEQQANEERKVTKTNQLIRDILGLFKRNTYIGYTATPFANIFIDPENDNDMLSHNLYPKDFMVKVPTPLAYHGQDFFFGDHSGVPGHVSPLININVTDHELKLLPITGQKKDMAEDLMHELSIDLKEAIRVFFIATAIRFFRGADKKHHTMIINISHLADVQNKLRALTEPYINEIIAGVRATERQDPIRACKNLEVRDLHETFEKIYPHLDEQWEDLFPQLQFVANKIGLKAINSHPDSQDNLDYETYSETGLVAIVIGGIKLSRGMTLEGLSVTYFARSSKMYDTLMQMCRWFGYRKGYDDLCRVYLTSDTIDWYSHIAEAIDELYEELHVMNRSNKTPSDFGLKVRDHPSSLIVTAKTKMRSATASTHSVSLWGQRQRRFRWDANDEESFKRGFNVTERFITKLKDDESIENNHVPNKDEIRIFKNVKHSDVIKYIEDMNMIEDEIGDQGLISHIKEIRKLVDKNFQVAFRTLSRPSSDWFLNEMSEDGIEFKQEYEFAGERIIVPSRTVEKINNTYKAPRTEMGQGGDESWFLSTDEIVRIKQEIMNRTGKQPDNKHYLRSIERDFPVLIIYPFNLILMDPYKAATQRIKGEYSLKSISNKPMFGYAISFPIDDPELLNIDARELRAKVNETKRVYMVGDVYRQLQMFGDIDYEEDEEDAYE